MVPKDLAAIRGKAYVSTPDEWLTGTEANEGFACLHFSVTGPQRWSYRYMGGPGPDGVQAFQAFAYSDLLGRGPGYADYVTVMGRVENGKLKVHWFFPPPPYE